MNTIYLIMAQKNKGKYMLKKAKTLLTGKNSTILETNSNNNTEKNVDTKKFQHYQDEVEELRDDVQRLRILRSGNSSTTYRRILKREIVKIEIRHDVLYKMLDNASNKGDVDAFVDIRRKISHLQVKLDSKKGRLKVLR